MEPEASDTQSLLEKAKRGDDEARQRLLAEHREPVRRMIGLRLDPAIAARLDASDVVQEVLLEASRRLDDYLRASAMPFHLWLRHIARDHIIDAHRRHRQAQRRGVDAQVVLPGHCLGDMLELASLDAEALRSVPGFGACRVARYAEQLVAELGARWND